MGGDLSRMSGSTSSSPEGQTVNVGGHSVQVGKEIGRGGSGTVYSATTSSWGSAAYKKLKPGAEWEAHEVAATRAAKQYIAHDDKGMVQTKVGHSSLKDHLKNNRDSSPGPMSAEIDRQINKQQDKAGYNHNDVKGENIRVGTKKDGSAKYRLVDWSEAKPGGASSRNKKDGTGNIREFCDDHMSFRSQGGRLFRRAGRCSKEATTGKKTTTLAKATPAGGATRAAPAQVAKPAAGGGAKKAASAAPTKPKGRK
ncbi:hypothetical protein DFJ73DRAFT_765334 [Zopfochytrium polystomum]|nr:hypothetical protein DFJ73DRAFT_765334 [Zopfochytrium polystomum]